MLEDLVKHCLSLSMKEKISLLKRIFIEVVFLGLFAILFFFLSLFFTWILTFLVPLEPYYHLSKPHFHVRDYIPNSLLTLYINDHLKQQVCSLSPQDNFFSEFTVPYRQYCNIDQLSLPLMKSPVNVLMQNIDCDRIAFVSGCIKHKGKEMSCQKYPSSEYLQVFRNLDFYNLYYLQVDLHLKKGGPEITSFRTPEVIFDEQCWWITKLVKNYYHLFTLVFNLGLTGVVTFGVLMIRIVYLMQENNKNRNMVESKMSKAGKETREKLNIKDSLVNKETEIIRSNMMMKREVLAQRQQKKGGQVKREKQAEKQKKQ